MNENKEFVEANTITVCQQAEGVVKYFGEFLFMLKEKGIYDRSTIIFTADHGKFNEGVVFPVFALKQPGHTGQIETDHRPLWAKDIRNIILNASGIQPLEDNIADPLQSNDVYSRIRKFFNYSGDQGERLPDLHLFEIKNGAIPVDTGEIYKTDGTHVSRGKLAQIDIDTHLSFDELLPYTVGVSNDHWSYSSYITLTLPIMEVTHDLEITLNLSIWKENAGKIIVTTPNRLLGEFSRDDCITADGYYSLKFIAPIDEMDEDQTLYIKLSFPSLPYELKTSGDLRRLGIHVSSLDIN